MKYAGYLVQLFRGYLNLEEIYFQPINLFAKGKIEANNDLLLHFSELFYDLGFTKYVLIQDPFISEENDQFELTRERNTPENKIFRVHLIQL